MTRITKQSPRVNIRMFQEQQVTPWLRNTQNMFNQDPIRLPVIQPGRLISSWFFWRFLIFFLLFFFYRVEFALKLGYTEKLVQAALQKLGSSPGQNELLAELIKLGAQRGSSCDSSPIEGPSDVADISNVELSALTQTLRHIVIDGSNVAMR